MIGSISSLSKVDKILYFFAILSIALITILTIHVDKAAAVATCTVSCVDIPNSEITCSIDSGECHCHDGSNQEGSHAACNCTGEDEDGIPTSDVDTELCIMASP